MSDLVGKRLGQYEILSAIGQGGMATVYKARQESMERDVAIKVISGQLAANPDFVARFEREARLIAKLQHPHILPVFDFGREGDLLFLAMRLVDGGSLDKRLKTGALPIVQGVRMFIQIASALTYAHDQGIIHRDLKPNNILLDHHDNPYLMDFGIAKMMADRNGLTATGAVMGTPSYMAPEQWRGESVDARTDIYALGCMLYEMLTGDLPFKGDTPFALMYKHFDAIPAAPRTLNPELPEAVNYVISRAIAKQQADRYPSADMMAEELAVAMGGTSFSLGVRATSTVPAVTPSQIKLDENESTFVGESESAPHLTQSGKTNVAGRTMRPRTTGRLGAEPELESVAVAPPAPPSRLPMILVGVGIVVLILLIGGGILLTSSSNANAQATSQTNNTQIAMGTSTQFANLLATTTALAMAPANTQLAIQAAAATQLAGTATAQAKIPTNTALPTQIRFTDFTDLALNVKFRQPADWEVQKIQNNFLVSAHIKDLKISQDGTITGPPYLLIMIGNSQELGALDMAKATTPMDAMTAMLGGERITNLDPVYGTHFPTATTTRPNPTLNTLRVLYLLMLGPDRFAVVLLQTSPEASNLFNDSVALPLVRSFDFATAPTEAVLASATPVPTSQSTFVAPTSFVPYTSAMLGLSLTNPENWKVTETSGQLVMVPPDSQVNLNDVNSGPYIRIVREHRADIKIYNAQYSIADIFRDNYGAATVNPRELPDAPYPTALGRALGQGGLNTNGWLVFVILDNDNFLTIVAQAPRGYETQYLNGVVVPIVKSLKYTSASTGGPTPTAAQ